MTINLKWVREIYRFDSWIGKSKRRYNEKKANSDSEISQYIRSKRTVNNLPDCYETRWIPKIKSWKSRSKCKHQYDKYNTSSLVDDVKITYNQLLYEVNKKPKHWVIVDIKYSYVRNDAAKMLVKENLVEPLYKTYSWTFNDFGKIKDYSKRYLIAIRLKDVI